MVRPYQPQDRASVLGLVEATGNFNAAEVAIAAELLDYVATRPEQRDYYAFVATAASTADICGMLILGPVPATTGSWHLYWIAVHPAHQGAGVAGTLQSFAESFVRERGGYWLVAETSGQPSYARARAFYLKHGFAQLARIPDYYKPSDDMVLFGKRLPGVSGTDPELRKGDSINTVPSL